MKEKQVQQILEELKQAYPRYDISTLPTKQRGNRYLIIVNGFRDEGDIDDFSVDIVYLIRWGMLDILEEQNDAMRDLRLLFIRGNQFVLYSPDVGCGNAFKEFKKPLHKEVYGYFQHQHYVCECQNINDVLEYLTTTDVWF